MLASIKLSAKNGIVAVQQLRIALVALVFVTALAGCVGSDDRLLDESEGLADPYFIGRFSYILVGKNRVIQLYLKDKKYLVEEDGKLVGFATLHALRDDFLIAQYWNTKAGGADPPYIYYLLRKTDAGFEAGDVCDDTQKPCKALTRVELLQKLDLQAKLLLAHPEKGFVVKRQ
jgi:hypothetical protein